MSAFGDPNKPRGKPTNFTFGDGFNDPRRGGPTTRKRPQKSNVYVNNGGKNPPNNGPNNNYNNNNNNNNNSNSNSSRPNDKRKLNGNRKRPVLASTKEPESTPGTDLPDPLDIPTRVIPRQTPGKLQNYSPQEIQATGQLLANPELLGFSRNTKVIPPRPIPKYLLVQPRLLHTPAFVQNAWDSENQAKMLALEQANSGLDYQGLYEVFQKMREVERKKMEDLGLVDAENIAKDLNDAISFQGSCLDMCPVFERVRRALENNVKALEKDPSTNKIARARAVKAFSRPAAGQPSPLPSEVRPPHILIQSLNYLVDNIVQQLPEAHSFIWDRTRSIRQDFTYQNSFGPEAIDCNERIVRIHLLSLHIMSGSEVEHSQQQELEQFNKALQTLIEIYQDVRNHGGQAPNEAEFRSYHLISHLRDPELEREIQTLPNHILQDKNVQLALRLRNIILQNNIVERGYMNTVGALGMFVEFFRVVYSDETPFLLACLLETHFNEIRFYALKAMARSYHTKGRAYPASSLQNLLGFDNIEKLTKFVTYYEIDLIDENGEILVDLFNKEKLETKYKLNSVHDKAKLSPIYSTQLDIKIQGKSLRDFINLGKSNANLNLKFDQRVLEMPDIAPLAAQTPQSTFGGTFATPPAPVQAAVSTASFPKSLHTVAPPSFGTTPNAAPKLPPSKVPFGALPQPVNQFSGRPPTQSPAQIQIPTIQKATPAQSSIPKQTTTASKPITFGKTSVPETAPIVPKAPSLGALESKPNFTFGQPKTTVVEKTAIPKIELVKEEPKIVTLPPTPTPPVQKKLSDSKYFNEAVGDIFQSILNGAVNEELSKILPKLIQNRNRRLERQEVITSLSSELYSAFLSEVIYNQSLEIKADFVYAKNVKLRTIRKLARIGSVLKEKHELKRKRLAELNSVSFKVPKRRGSTASLPSTKRHDFKEKSPLNITQRQQEIQELWAPLNLKAFVAGCSQKVQLSIEKEIALKFLVVVENWSSPYSKWLNTKLSLKADKEKMLYQNLIQDKISVEFSSLPSGLNKDFFSNTGFILFECGLPTTGEQSIVDKLKKDEVILKKISTYATKFSEYKVQLLVVFWDVTGSGLSTEEVTQALNLHNYEDSELVVDITLCDMTVQNGNINEILAGGFKNIENTFTGQLTKRGIKKMEKMRQVTALKEMTRKRDMNAGVIIKEKESQILDRAKRARRYEYLNKHLTPTPSNGTSIDITTNSPHSANSSFMTANNKSILHHLTTIRRNETINSNSTIGNTTTFNNGTILTGFGNGMIEESTPFSSPNSKRLEPKKPLPKSVQQLRDLALGIRARYKK